MWRALAGGSFEGTCKAVCKAAAGRGYRPGVLIFRGCSGLDLLTGPNLLCLLHGRCPPRSKDPEHAVPRCQAHSRGVLPGQPDPHQVPWRGGLWGLADWWVFRGWYIGRHSPFPEMPSRCIAWTEDWQGREQHFSRCLHLMRTGHARSRQRLMSMLP